MAGATVAPPPVEPIVIDGVTYKPGSGQFAGLYAAPGKGWVQIVEGKPTRAKVPAQPRSTGRTLGGVAALLVAALAIWQGLSWIGGGASLQADGNPFAGILGFIGLGALTVGAAFGIWGITLLSRK